MADNVVSFSDENTFRELCRAIWQIALRGYEFQVEYILGNQESKILNANKLFGLNYLKTIDNSFDLSGIAATK